MTEEKEITINKTELPIQEHIVKNDTEFKIVDLEQVIKRLEQERDKLKKTVENQKLEYEELQCDYNELEQRHNDAFEQFKEMKARHDELLASCEQSDQEAAEIINELKQENKELKSQASLYENLYNHHGEIVDEYRKQRNKIILYRKALEEIREIAKDIIENDVYENSDAKAEKILNKINEVLE